MDTYWNESNWLEFLKMSEQMLKIAIFVIMS